MIKEFKYDLQGKELKITIGKVAEQANGACLVQMEDTVLLVTATASDMPREGVDFFPLSCDFEEKLYSVGKIPGGFIKREGRPSEKAVLISRLIDRPLRPLFPEDYRNDVQVIASALSYDNENSIEMLAMIGSSISLSISDIPFMGPTAAVVVAYVDGKYIINPNSEQQSKSKLNLTVAGTKESIMMIESGSNILSEDEIIDGILFAHEEIKSICDFISEIQNEVGLEKVDYEKPNYNQNIVKEIEDFSYDKLNTILRDSNKVTREENQKYFEDTTLEHFLEIYPDDEETIRYAIEKITKYLVRRMIAVEKIRPDGRKLDEIRKLSAEVGVLPRTHGSGLFTRGQTQVLSLTTLGAPSEVQTLDGLTEDEKRYMHQYNFPPYSVGDTKPLRSPGRREIGHGALAERALLPVIPEESDFPYTIRVVSEVLSSNGSSSQASVCGSTLSLLDAGVPLKDSVAGIAMGLIQDENTKDYTILTDIQGLEDHLGDMDFKVAGTKDGITAIQMDIKIDGVSKEILTEALDRAKSARLQILDVMNNCIDKPRENISKYAPRIFSFNINPDKIREIIGPGGKVINKIIDETGVKIDTYDDGRVVVTSDNQENGRKSSTNDRGYSKRSRSRRNLSWKSY